MNQNLDYYPLPSLVFHADWSIHPQKRVMACAIMNLEGRYSVSQPEMIEDLNIKGWIFGKLQHKDHV